MVGTTDLNRPVRSRATGPAAGDDDAPREPVATTRANRARVVTQVEIEPATGDEGSVGDTVTVAFQHAGRAVKVSFDTVRPAVRVE